MVLPLLTRKDLNTLLRMQRLWAVLIVGNLFGTSLFALCLGKIVIFNADTQECLNQISTSHRGPSFGIVLMRAIFPGWLIRRGIGASQHYHHHLPHRNQWIQPHPCRIHNNVFSDCYALAFMGSISHAILPSHLLGNVIGGVSIVAALGHAQVVGRKEQ